MGAEGGFCLRRDSPRTDAGGNLAAHVPVTLSESDLSVNRQCRGTANRLGFAVQFCYMRYPGVILGADFACITPPFLVYLASKLL